MIKIVRSLLALAVVSSPLSALASEISVDVFVYGGTPGGVAAALTAARSGHKVVLADPTYFVGGMMAGGLTKTDVGDRDTIGGVSKEFFDRVFDYYKKTYGADSTQAKQSHRGVFFEPKVAALISSRCSMRPRFRSCSSISWIKSTKPKKRLVSATLQPKAGSEASDRKAQIFIDATYEGDLLALAGVPYRVGREAREEYNESLAGMTDGPRDVPRQGRPPRPSLQHPLHHYQPPGHPRPFPQAR